MSFSLNIQAQSGLKKIKGEQKDVPCRLQTDGNNELMQYYPSRSSLPSKSDNSSVLPELLRAWPDAIVTTTAGGGIKSLNQNAETLFGFSQADLAGQDVSALFGNSFRSEHVICVIASCEKREWLPVECDDGLQGRRKNGELFPVKLLVSECGLDGPMTHIYHVTDITLQVRQQQQVEQLEREVAYLARHSLLGELATTITHELSQPLTAITNYTAAAGRCWAQPSGQNVENGLELIRKAGEQAKRAWVMMHRLRRLLQHRGSDFNNDDMRLAAEEAIELSTLGAGEYGISLEVDLPHQPVIVRMDRIQVQILLANLIRNAVDELRVVKGERKIRIRLATDNDGMAVFSVEDTGPGIAPAVFENIFEPFLTTKPEGLGVGLAVSRRIALAHDGRLAARNRPEGGAAFSFLVPLSGGEEGQPAAM
jgi:two-component system sensor kinase FixL